MPYTLQSWMRRLLSPANNSSFFATSLFRRNPLRTTICENADKLAEPHRDIVGLVSQPHASFGRQLEGGRGDLSLQKGGTQSQIGEVRNSSVSFFANLYDTASRLPDRCLVV